MLKQHASSWQSPRLETLAGWRQPPTFLRYLFRQSHWDEVMDYENGDLELTQQIGTDVANCPKEIRQNTRYQLLVYTGARRCT